MAKNKAPEPLPEYQTTATPKAYAGGIPVFCAHDAIVKTSEMRPNPKNPNEHPDDQIRLLGEVIRS
ncbi:MAG: DNA methylase, partial [Clostridia bacterium]|nr:DNA methylase [Clostridia bacterium]